MRYKTIRATVSENLAAHAVDIQQHGGNRSKSLAVASNGALSWEDNNTSLFVLFSGIGDLLTVEDDMNIRLKNIPIGCFDDELGTVASIIAHAEGK